jgi:protocatechuate 3,4-dioxygenase beta subunit
MAAGPVEVIGQQSPSPPPATASISGVVVTDDATSSPLRRARVWIGSTGGGVRQSTVTDDNGRFRFERLAGDRFMLSAEKPAYISSAFGARAIGGPGVPIALTEGQAMAGVVLRLARGGVISGRVLGPAGQPLSGASIRLSKRTSTPNTRIIVSATADDEGVYRLFGLRPGRYLVSATAPAGSTGGRIVSAAEVSWAKRTGSPLADAAPPRPRLFAFTESWYPGVTQAAQAIEIVVAAGEERVGIDIPLSLVQVGSVSGVVLQSDGRPASGLQVLLMPRVRETGTDSEGRFTFPNVTPGTYTVSSATGPVSPRSFGQTEVTVSGDDVTGMTVRLVAGTSVEGRIAIAGAEAAAFLPSRLGVRLTPRESARLPARLFATANEDGRFRLADMPPGSYEIDASIQEVAGGDNDWSIRGVRAGGRDVLDRPIELDAGGTLSDLVVSIGRGSTEITGLLLDQAGRPAPELYVQVFPLDPSRWRESSRWMQAPSHPASDGRFVIRGLPAGEYYFAVLPSFETDDWHTAQVLEQIVPGAIRFTLREGERLVRDFRIGAGP